MATRTTKAGGGDPWVPLYASGDRFRGAVTKSRGAIAAQRDIQMQRAIKVVDAVVDGMNPNTAIFETLDALEQCTKVLDTFVELSDRSQNLAAPGRAKSLALLSGVGLDILRTRVERWASVEPGTLDDLVPLANKLPSVIQPIVVHELAQFKDLQPIGDVDAWSDALSLGLALAPLTRNPKTPLARVSYIAAATQSDEMLLEVHRKIELPWWYQRQMVVTDLLEIAHKIDEGGHGQADNTKYIAGSKVGDIQLGAYRLAAVLGAGTKETLDFWGQTRVPELMGTLRARALDAQLPGFSERYPAMRKPRRVE